MDMKRRRILTEKLSNLDRAIFELGKASKKAKKLGVSWRLARNIVAGEYGAVFREGEIDGWTAITQTRRK